MGGLGDVVDVELLDKRSLNCGAAGREFGGIDGRRGGGGSENTCGLGKQEREIGGDFGGVRGSA